ncbi:MAG: sulfite exporter TauE/SafE family protein [Clostridia bacterium]|nr:sulfite exporter TauE/SafE family protein [Clostridia bacterium]MBR2431491.1 sulfite exporter TauE/SafE family protein [Clostridia bacterium]
MQYILLFLEGMITFISPCLLPMLPIYVSYFAGDGEGNTRRVIKNALGFIIGFTAVFVTLGALAGTVGQLLKDYATVVNIVTGIIVIFFGLNFLGIFKLNIFKGSKFSGTKKLGFFSSLLFGIVFSIGWTPCVGAFLGSALMIAANQGHVVEGMLMLLVYSLGLGIPFFISAVLVDKLKGAFSFIKKHYNVINVISGVLLVAVGLLMATGLFGKLLSMLA